jgi:rubrerythrin
MPAFADPFYGNLPPRKMSLTELVRAIRMNVAAEEEATAIYEAHADATDNPVARKVLLDIANEERVHVGEFIELIEILTQDEKAWMENGYDEVREMAAEVAKGDLEPATPAEKAAEEGKKPESVEHATIGSLKED